MMIWTKEKPTKPGWYWYRVTHTGRNGSYNNDSVVFVSDDESNADRPLEVWFNGNEMSEFIESVNGQWAGPIPEPRDPEVRQS